MASMTANSKNNQYLKGSALLSTYTFIIMVVATLTVLALLLIFLGKLSEKKHFQRQEKITTQLAEKVDKIVSKTHEISRTLSKNPYIINRFLNIPSPGTKDEENREIDISLNSIQIVTGAEVVFLLDHEGLIISSTTYDGVHTLVGTRAPLRPYFLEAINGKTFIYGALGYTTHIRGLYFSCPVYSESQSNQTPKPIGVAVIKLGVEFLDRIFQSSNLKSGIVLEEGVIFSSNPSEWLYKLTTPLSEERLLEIRNSRQFADKKLSPLPFSLDHKRVKIGDQYVGVVKKTISIPNWYVYTVDPIYGEYPVSFAILGTIAILVLAFMVGLNLVNLHKKRISESEKKKAEEEIIKQNEFLITVLDSLAYPFFIINLGDYSIAMSNKTAREEHFSPMSIPQKPSSENTHPCKEINGVSICPIEKIKETRKPLIVNYSTPPAEGPEKNYEIHIYPLFDGNGNLTQIIEYAIDISSRKKMEDELLNSRQLESIGILAGGIAHDFNNLLSVIIGNITLVKDEIPPEEKNFTFLTHAEESAIKAADLAQKLTTFSRGGWLEKRELSFGLIIKHLIEFNELKVEQPVSLETNIPKDLFPVNGDLQRLKQVITNLVQNALESLESISSPDRLTIRIEAMNILSPSIEIPGFENLPHQKHNRYVKVSIVDKGRGIPRENLRKVFDPYFTTKRVGDQKGMGLGLTLCYSIIKKHEGYLNLQSEADKGTRVDIYLPVFIASGRGK